MEHDLKECLPLGLAILLLGLCFRIVIKEMNSYFCMRTSMHHSTVYTHGNEEKIKYPTAEK